MESVTIGLDIGSSAVRAAEVAHVRGRRVLRRIGQVGLPPDAVRDGEIVNAPVVSEALKRLWSSVGFSSNRVVLGVSGHRVIVRQADVPALNEEDLRSSLRFDAQDLIPIPMDEACFDFTVLDRGKGPGADGKSTMRILLVAAHRELLGQHLAALAGAGLEAVAIDAMPLALLRVVPPNPDLPPGSPSADVVVAIGSDLTTVAVRQDGSPRFIRSLDVGGAKITAGLAASLHTDLAAAEALKRDSSVLAEGSSTMVRRALAREVHQLADEVRGTVEFFLAQAEGAVVQHVMVTGGAIQVSGLTEELQRSLGGQVSLIDPYQVVDLADVGLGPEQLQSLATSSVSAVGLALWTAEEPSRRLSVLPEEIAAARRARRISVVAIGSVVALAAGLGVSAYLQLSSVHKAQDAARSAQQQTVALKAEVQHLETVTAVHGQVSARRQLVVSALKGEVDWVRVVGQLASVMPTNLRLDSLSGSAVIAGAPTSSGTVQTGVGSLSFTVEGTGGLPSVAQWIQQLESDPDLAGTWVSSIKTDGSGNVSFSSLADLTPTAHSNRAQEAGK